MKTFQFTVKDPVGIHARPAGMLVKEVKTYSSTITIAKDGKAVNALKLMALMGLGVKCGETVTVTVEGENEAAEAEALLAYLKANL